MNPLARIVILAVVILGAAVWAMRSHDSTVERYEYQLARERLHNAWLERVGFVHALDDERRYRDETSSLVKWYQAETTAVYNRFPGSKATDALAEMEAQVAAGKMQKGELESRREWYDTTRRIHDLFSSGRYNPLATTTAGGVRLDIVSLQRTVYEKRNLLRMDVVVWGAPRRQEQTQKEHATTVKMLADFSLETIGMELIDDKKKLVGGMDGGKPVLVVEHPERWIPDFPPQALLATWYFDPLKAEAATMDLRLGGEIRSQFNGALPVSFGWKLPVQPEWRAREGEKFEGEERVMPEADMDRSAP